MRNKRQLAIILSSLLVFAAIVAIVVSYINQGKENLTGLKIANYDTYVKNLPKSERELIENMLYETVLLNGVKEEDIKNVKDALIRESSYKQEFDKKIYTTHFIVDIKSLKKSFRVEDLYSNLSPEQSGLYDYTLLVLCLDKKDLIYGEFKCQDRMSVENGLEQFDPIIQHLPESNLDYSLSLDTSSRKPKVNATLYLSEVDYRLGLESAIEQRKETIKKWFISNSLDINNYIIEYKY